MYTGGRHFRQPSTEHNAATGKGPMRQTFRALILAAFVCVLLAGSFSDAQTRPEHASARSRIEARRQRLKNVIAEEWEFELRDSPLNATEYGDYRSEEHTSELQSLRHLVC